MYKQYTSDNLRAGEAQRAAHLIAFAPVVFQVSRCMLKFGLLNQLADNSAGLSQDELAERCRLSSYATQILLEASLSIGLVIIDEDKYKLTKTGYFLLTDPLIRANLDFNHDVNYKGLFHLDEALQNGRPEGLKELGNWPTIYEALSSLPAQVQKSWFGFDHFYSDASFNEALAVVFQNPPKRLLDVGGNTGRWALRCVAHNPDVRVTVMDLPQQTQMMAQQTKGKPGAERIDSFPADLLDSQTAFPIGYDAIWMSQFLDCFSETQVISILQRAAASMDQNSTLYIMETFWDRQQYETAAMNLTLTSVYFTALANGNSKMFKFDDLQRCIQLSGLKIDWIKDHVGLGHSIIALKLAN